MIWRLISPIACRRSRRLVAIGEDRIREWRGMATEWAEAPARAGIGSFQATMGVLMRRSAGGRRDCSFFMVSKRAGEHYED